MNTLHFYLSLAVAFLFCAFSAQSQNSLAYQGGTSFNPNKSTVEKTPIPRHFYKKLPALYEGYAIEVETSTYPLDRKNPLFRQFGNIHYDKLERGSYSYLILGKFSSDKSALEFLHKVIVPQDKDAKLIHYKDGIRKIVRES